MELVRPKPEELRRYGLEAMMLLSCHRQLPPISWLKNPVCRRWQERCGDCPYAVKGIVHDG